MKKVWLLVASLVCLLAFVGNASASRHKNHVVIPVVNVTVCYHGATSTVTGNPLQIAIYFLTHVGATLGACPVVVPPVVLPPVVVAPPVVVPPVPVPVPVVVVLPPQLPTNTFLCYSKFGVETLPAVFRSNVAVDLFKGGGYFLPVAVPGKDASGNNIGAFHLVCNPASSRVLTGQWLGGSGEVYSAAVHALYDAQYNPDLGIYAIAR